MLPPTMNGRKRLSASGPRCLTVMRRGCDDCHAAGSVVTLATGSVAFQDSNLMPSAMVLSKCAAGRLYAVLFLLCWGFLAPGDARGAEYTESTGTEGNGDHVVGPDYAIDLDLTDRGNPKGQQVEFSLPLAESKIFPGTDATLDPKKPVRKERKITVYVPAAYKDGDKAPILVTLDGPSRLNLVRNALDNLTVSKDPNRKLPAFIVIAVENGGNDGKGSERGLEYDTMSDRFARFINDEVLPAVLENDELQTAYPQLAITDNPWGRGVMGCSSGGAAALTMGWFRPDLFRRLVTYSGTFVDQQDDDAAEEGAYPLGAWEYHSGKKLIETSEKKPLRIFTHVSENDNRANDPEETYHNWVMANQRTAAALAAKGYDYRYVFSKASKHCDGNVFDATLADTLVWMWRGYHAE
jgi:enterochelin esterase family protein